MSGLAALKNLGPKSAAALRRAGIRAPQQLLELGAVAAFLRLEQAGERPSLNFLYALEGAIRQQHWQQIARTERERLIFELEGRRRLGTAPPEGK